MNEQIKREPNCTGKLFSLIITGHSVTQSTFPAAKLAQNTRNLGPWCKARQSSWKRGVTLVMSHNNNWNTFLSSFTNQFLLSSDLKKQKSSNHHQQHCLYFCQTSLLKGDVSQCLANNMGAIQVWLDNSSFLAFWICFEYDNEHYDVWRVTCYADPETIFICIDQHQHQHSCVPMMTTEIFPAEQTE